MQIEQNWQIKYSEEEKYPFLIVDNWYTPNEERAVWSELNFYNALPKKYTHRAENTLTAKKDGKSLSSSYRYYIDKLYKDTAISPILNCKYKQNSKEFIDLVQPLLPYSRNFVDVTEITSMVSYYGNNDEYKEHWDTSSWTMCIWFFNEPKLFKGGEFQFPEFGAEIELKHNRAVFFPGCYLHKVKPLMLSNENEYNNNGKYTITHFFFNQE